jgi:predicted transcriptional regulator of viral defense system
MSDERSKSSSLRNARADCAVAELARRQHGIVSLAQMRAVGLGTAVVKHRLATGRLHRVHRGVYAVGHARLTLTGRLWAAVLATGGVLSHQTAGYVWALVKSPGSRLHVTITAQRRSATAIQVHRSRTLFLDAIRRDPDHGLPVTSPARTLTDLSTTLTAHRLERAVHRAEELRLLDVAALPDTPRLRRALSTLQGDPVITRQELEERFYALVAEGGLPRPRHGPGVRV